MSHWYFHPANPAAGVLLRVHQPELHGDVVKRPALRGRWPPGPRSAGIELGRTAYAVRVVRPWRQEGRLIGYVELGTDIHAFLVRLARLTGDEFGMLLDKRRLDRNAWQRGQRPPGALGRAARAARGGQHRAATPRCRPGWSGWRRSAAGRRCWGARPATGGPGRAGSSRCSTREGKVIGAVVERHEISALLAGVDELRLQVVVLVVLLAAALAALVIFLLETLVFEPVARMTQEARGAAGADGEG